MLERWPEPPFSEDTVTSSNSERFIPEVRDNDEDIYTMWSFGRRQSFRFLQTYIRRSVNKLRRADEGDQLIYDGQHEVAESLGKLYDQGVIEAIPGLVQKLERKALLSMYSIFSGKAGTVRNRAYLMDRTKELYREVLPGQPLSEPTRDVVTILRDPDSYKKMETRKIELEGSSPVEAARAALLQIDQLPLKDMHVMLRTLRDSPPLQMDQLKVGGNKDRLRSSIRNTAESLLDSGDGDKLPEPVSHCYESFSYIHSEMTEDSRSSFYRKANFTQQNPLCPVSHQLCEE